MFGKVLTASVVAGLLAVGSAAAQGKSESAPGQDRVCLITFNAPGTEANTAVTTAKVLPRKAAQAQANDTTRIYEYGPGGSLTAEACECLNNPDTRPDCDQPIRTG
jgi:hypothetical protein